MRLDKSIDKSIDTKKIQIIEIAFDLFLKVGYEATTMRMICKKAKVEAPTVYYYFGSKSGLFFAVVDYLLAEYETLKKKSQLEKSKCAKERLKTVFVYSLQYAMFHKEETRFFLRYTLFTPDELKVALEEYMRTTYESKKKLYMDCLIACGSELEKEMDMEVMIKRVERLIDDCSFNVVFSEWRPTLEEMEKLWNIFYYVQIAERPCGGLIDDTSAAF